MSDLSNKKKAPILTESLGGAAALDADVQAKVKPVTIWATVGGALLVLQVYVWTRWITGPYFERVPGGTTDPCSMRSPGRSQLNPEARVPEPAARRRPGTRYVRPGPW